MRRRIVLYLFSLIAAWVVAIGLGCGQEEASTRKVAIVHPILVEALREVEAGIRDEMGSDRYEFISRSGEGDDTKYQGIVEATLALKPDVFIAVGTEMSQTVLNPRFDRERPPVISTAITDPKDVLGDDLGVPRETKVTVISDTPQDVSERVIEMARAFLPDLEKVGIFYNPEEANSLSSANDFLAKAQAEGLETVKATITRAEDLADVVESLLLKGAEAIIIGKDKIGTGSASVVVQTCLRGGKEGAPRGLVFAMDEGTVREHHVVGAASASYRAIGVQTARVAMRILAGEDVREIPTSGPEHATIYLSDYALELFGLEVPSGLSGEVVRIPKAGATEEQQ